VTEKPYHHGDLRKALIEAGIELISKNGADQFSIRKISAMCNVSHTASYAHFKDIDALYGAMREHVTTLFMKTLQDTIAGHESNNGVIIKLGKAYITFFMENPNYFQFLFYQAGVTINLDDEFSCDYPPFALFRDISYQMLQNSGLPRNVQKQLLISNWSLVHGIAALVSNPNIQYSGDWITILEYNERDSRCLECLKDKISEKQ